MSIEEEPVGYVAQDAEGRPEGEALDHQGAAIEGAKDMDVGEGVGYPLYHDIGKGVGPVVVRDSRCQTLLDTDVRCLPRDR